MKTRSAIYGPEDFAAVQDPVQVWVEWQRNVRPNEPGSQWVTMNHYITTMTRLGRGTSFGRFHIDATDFAFPYQPEQSRLEYAQYRAVVYHLGEGRYPGWDELQDCLRIALQEGRTFWVLRGPSGVGKSTFTQTVMSQFDPVVLCMDDYHMMGDRYNFSVYNISESVDYTQRALLREVSRRGHNVNIVLDKTASRYWEYGLEMEMAECFGYMPVVVQLGEPSVWSARELFIRNRHGVDMEVIQRQISRWQPDPNQYVLAKDSWPVE